MNAITLLIERNSQLFLLPDDEFMLIAGDQLLVASPLAAQRNFEFTVRNANELDYVLSGSEESGSWLWRRLSGAKAAKIEACSAPRGGSNDDDHQV